MNDQTVSVVITTRNRCGLLMKAVKSVQEQTLTDFQCVVVDDGSTDKTEENIAQIVRADNRFSYIKIAPEDSKGGNHARNTGIKATTGEYIAFLDDDDIWMPQKLELQSRFLNKHRQIGLVYCQVIREYVNEGVRRKQVPDMSYRGDCSKKVFSHIPCTTSTMMVRRSVLEQAGLFDEKMKFWQEYDLCIRICQITEIDFIKKYLVVWRCDTQDKNRMTNKLTEWGSAVKQQNQKYCRELAALPKGAREARKLMIFSDAVQRSHNCGDKRASRYYLWKIYRHTGEKKDLFAFLCNDASEYV
ncbi:MAG: glycosyltransferase family 2 protein [bacterium]|nr:glycosyltransferase family 2 protein [bacterium]